MKFKDGAIKPGMAIHCPQKEDVIAFLNYLKDFGFNNIDWMYHNNITDDMYVYTKSLRCELDFIRRKSDLVDGTFAEISDLIESDDISEKCFYPLQKEDPDEKIFGNWEPVRGTAGKLLYYKCKACGSHSQTPYSYCPDCGKHMCGKGNEIGSPIEMTLDEAIAHCDEKTNCTACGQQHAQIAKWLRELKSVKENLTENKPAEKVLDWLKKYDGKPEMLEVFGREFYNGAMDLDADEIVRRIATYEAAKKAPKPVEVECGWLCEIYDKEWHAVDEKEIWEGDEEHAKHEAAERAKQYVAENGETALYQVYGICRVKENK